MDALSKLEEMLYSEMEEISFIEEQGDDASLWRLRAEKIELDIIRAYMAECREDLADSKFPLWFHVDVKSVEDRAVARLICSYGYSDWRSYEVKVAGLDAIIPLL